MSLTLPDLTTIQEVLNEKIKLQKQVIARTEINSLKKSFNLKLKFYEFALKDVEEEINKQEKEFDETIKEVIS